MTTTQKIAIADQIRSAVIEAMDEVATLEELATCLRLIQLMNQAAHPDDSIGWSTDGTSGSAMAQLEAELQNHNGMDETCDQRARELLALIQIGQTTLDVIESGEERRHRHRKAVGGVMSTHTDKSHHLSVDGGCIRTNIYLDQDQLRLIVQCLRSGAVRMSRPTDSQCWALCDEREQQCNRLVNQILTAGFDVEERIALRGMEVTA